MLHIPHVTIPFQDYGYQTHRLVCENVTVNCDDSIGSLQLLFTYSYNAS